MRETTSYIMSPAAEGFSRRPATVCVTGAAGYIGSWLVKELLHRGYVVRGTARDLGDPKNCHLESLEGAKERLTLYQADVLDYGSLWNAFVECDGIFHVASPVTTDSGRVRDAVEGTKNVVRCAAEVGIRRIVFTSSFGAVHMNPSRSPDAVVDESCWSDLDYCKSIGDWYSYAKTTAERCAMEEARERRVELLVVVPSVTIGPMLQSELNVSVHHLVKYITGIKKKCPDAVIGYVDVRDVARAHVLVYENPAASGRYLCMETILHRRDLARMLKEMFPQYPVTESGEDAANAKVKPYKFSNQRLKDLGLKFTSIRHSLYDTVMNLQEKGDISIVQVTPRGQTRYSTL